MRSRNIKPGFFKNEVLASLPFEARLLFIGLWCMADREGRLEDRPKRIEAEIFPYEKICVEKHMHALASTCPPFINRYSSNENQYIQILNFTKHQSPNSHEKQSDIPACIYKAHAKKRNAPLIPDVLIPDSPILNHRSARVGWFEQIWNDYPKKIGKKQADRHFQATVQTEEDFKHVQAALLNYKRYIHGKEMKYVQNASTWFNNWHDWTEYTENSHATHDGESPGSWLAQQRAKINTQKTGKNAASGLVHTSLSDMPEIRPETGSRS